MKLARIKQFATSVAIAVSTVFSLGMGMPVAAMPASPMEGMDHGSTSITNCIDQHHVAPGASQKVKADEPKDEDNEPTPQPLPYFMQFQKVYAQQQQVTPQDITRSSSYRPPDILRLTSNVRF